MHVKYYDHHDVYITNFSKETQWTHQLGHEIFHLVQSNNTFHWTHEMMAEYFSITNLFENPNFEEYANIQVKEHI